MQREACWTRRGAGGAEFVQGNGYLAAAYLHRSSRNGDPQLHTHVLIANATKGPDGRWTRLYHPAIYDHAKTAGYIYEAHLRHELTRRLGVEWQPVRKGIAEIEGFADEHLRAFSTRRAEILEAAGRGRLGPRPTQVATLATRKPKEADVSPRRAARALASAEPRRSASTARRSSATFEPSGPSRRRRARTVSTWQVDRAVTAARVPLRPPRRDPGRRRLAARRSAGGRGRAHGRRLPRLRVGDPDRREPPKAPATPPGASGSLSARRWRRSSGCAAQGPTAGRGADRRPRDRAPARP